ncbi:MULTISPECIES: type II secretion system ATPase GspE [Tenebrionibacter/Tenebrionicola group]|uniref:Type II secretion system protein E n=2 Tax=Tenebrionibacter/Tenebrionicola group TaxID=2969848 RepID=A0A8K0XZZ1_9ENTR|nr:MULTISPECIES: type II secretion system ATPase GspE [Tenebrionibacter/Tenebrionicola group]MBK4716104.1 type II secretion system ATPase GspE [Tenebrionibacter intestinalis]MBV5095967.1 type II secretion system ATPase GspE [Tenebrionicola larvae]
MTALTPAFARRHGVLLTRGEGDNALLLCRSEAMTTALLEARRVAGGPMQVSVLDDEEFERQLVAYYQQSGEQVQRVMEELGNDTDFYALAEELPELNDLLESEDGAPIIRLINAMLGEAIKEGASDIHIETFERSLSIRFRVDGVLREILQPQRRLAALMVSRIKVMARLDIAEKRVPQDGRISLRLGGRMIDVRVSTLPVNHGERVVLRLLDKNSVRLDLASLGMAPALHRHMTQLLAQPHGILLVTGPTGAGKSTTLYAALSQINSKERNILTIEDPVEYELPGVGQTQVNTKVKMTFARGLRAILRQDPDVVMVGEIRDAETAAIAVQASLTGHLVLSTLHTNSAAGAVTRLRDMGVEPFLLATSLTGVLAQRLVRVLCRECRRPERLTEKGILPAGSVIYHPAGCPACNFTGYRGRTAIYELLRVNDALRAAIQRQDDERALAQSLCGDTLYQNGLALALEGVTSPEEVTRVTRSV